MRFLRAAPTGIIIALVVSTILAGGSSAYAQDSGDAQKKAEEAQAKAETAAGLVDAAVANKVEIETQLAASMTKIADLSDRLSTVSLNLKKIEEQILFADSELGSIQDAIEIQAVDAYMNALTFTPISFVNSTTVETAIVAGVVVDELVTSNQAAVDRLVFKKKDLEALHASQQAKQEEVAGLRMELDAEIEHLATLYERADADVAAAIRAANAADAEYRAALSAVEVAQAEEAEQKRQEDRGSPPTTTPSSPDTSSPPTTSPPTTSPPTTSGGSGGWTGIPAVEQWRALVSAHFPAGRVDEALQIMQCESLGDPDAYNPYSGASGLFQFLPSTWAATAPSAGYPGASVFDPEANVASAAWLAGTYADLGLYYWQPWSCRWVLE